MEDFDLLEKDAINDVTLVFATMSYCCAIVNYAEGLLADKKE